MKIEHIVKREDGTQYMITVNSIEFRNEFTYRIDVYVKQKGKRKFNSLPAALNDYQIRITPFSEREKYRIDNILRFVTPNEIHEAKLKCWNSMKPTIDL